MATAAVAVASGAVAQQCPLTFTLCVFCFKRKADSSLLSTWRVQTGGNRLASVSSSASAVGGVRLCAAAAPVMWCVTGETPVNVKSAVSVSVSVYAVTAILETGHTLHWSIKWLSNCSGQSWVNYQKLRLFTIDATPLESRQAASIVSSFSSQQFSFSSFFLQLIKAITININ